MKSYLTIAGLAGWALVAAASARTWTDTTGRTLEADLVRVEGTKVVIKLKGRDVPLEMARLSADDQKFVTDWQAQQGGAAAPGAAPAVAGEWMLCGTKLQAGGAVTTVEEPLSAATMKEFSKLKGENKPTKLKLAVALPKEFDPAKPQRVMWVCAAINNEQEGKAGNVGAMRSYAGSAAAAGWVVIAADTDLGNPRQGTPEGSDLAVLKNAVEVLSKAWPGFKTWEFGCCGFSGGAKLAFMRAAELVATDLKVIGMYLTGCNQDLSDEARAETRCRKAGLRLIKVFISNGKDDPIATMAQAQALEKSVKSNGYGKVQLVLFEGGHELRQDEFKKALDWFIAVEEKPRR